MKKQNEQLSLRVTDKISCLSGVGEQRVKLYKKLGVDNIYSLLQFYPRAYLDLSCPVSIGNAVLNEVNVIKARVFKRTGEQFIRKGLTLFKVYVTDDIDNLAITIFNSRYIYDDLSEGTEYYFYGKVTGTLLKREMASPTFIKADTQTLLRPIYSLTDGLSGKMVQTQVKSALSGLGDNLRDFLPDEIVRRYALCHRKYAFENIHFPVDAAAYETAKRRLIFDELLVLQLGLLLIRNKNHAVTGASFENTDISEFYTALPFVLTDGQQMAIDEALTDMKSGVPMNRLCQGDVGSGKTMVAAALSFTCHKNGCQAAIMAPTQILAEQHYATLSGLLSPLGVTVCLLTGSQKAAERKDILSKIENGECSVIIGTHAIIEDSVSFSRLALVVTDEQHRFGVSQRAKLAKKGDNPHLFIMSATPIPRTLALIIYGDLDISVIKELPKGRVPIETYTITSAKRGRALGFIKKHIDKGQQAYIVCPLIEENNSDLVSVDEYVAALKQTPLSNYTIEALNGKLKPAQKEAIMARFKSGEVSILVATTVIEVGVDVPNAVVMLIENAERFGLSQLHQLRGRVGRGNLQSYCILLSDKDGEENKMRLKTMCDTSDGFVIAEQDLKLRGPGDFFGFKQHGLPSLKIASLADDMTILNETALLAKEILQQDSDLSSRGNKGLKREVLALFSPLEEHREL